MHMFKSITRLQYQRKRQRVNCLRTFPPITIDRIQSREEGVLQLRLNADNEMRPLFKGKLIGFKDDEGELIEEMKVSIPKD